MVNKHASPQNEASRALELDASAVAEGLPALLAEAERLAATLTSGAHGRRRAGTGEAFWQYRDYTQNDPASAIDWRQSARSPRRLYVRETEWETAASVRIWCGGDAGFDFASANVPSKRWRSYILSTALAYSLVRAGEKIGVLPADTPTRSGAAGVMQFAEYLIAGRGSADLPPPDRKATHAVYLSDFYYPTDKLLKRIQAFSSLGVPCHFVEITDPAEESFPYSGHIQFQNPGNPSTALRFGRAEDVRHTYQTTRQAHRQALQDACRHFGHTFIAHRTDQPAGSAFAALHHALSGSGRR